MAEQPGRLTTEDVRRAIEGFNGFLAALGKVFPGATPEEIVAKAAEVEASPVAQELLAQALNQAKVRL